MTSLTGLGTSVGEHLKASGETLAVTESSTGGLVSASLLAVPGASAYFKGGSVVYTLASRKALLGITGDHVQGLEPLTEAMVQRFAEVARAQLDTTWGIAELGVAGPAGARYGPSPGISVIAVDGPYRASVTIETGSSDRESNMWHFTRAALQLLEKVLVTSPR